MHRIELSFFASYYELFASVSRLSSLFSLLVDRAVILAEDLYRSKSFRRGISERTGRRRAPQY